MELVRVTERIEWNDDYCVGNELLDAQHKHLFELVNQIGDLFGNSSADARTQRALNCYSSLTKYATDHFVAEERVLRKLGWAGLDEHRRQHEAFEKFIFSDEVHRMLVGSDLARLYEYLVAWLRTHVIVEDQKYKEAVSAQT